MKRYMVTIEFPDHLTAQELSDILSDNTILSVHDVVEVPQTEEGDFDCICGHPEGDILSRCVICDGYIP